MIATGAQAATTTVTPSVLPDATADAAAHDVVDAVLNNVGDVIASVIGTSGGLNQDVSLGTDTTFTVDGNDVLSSAIANNAVNTLDAVVLDNDIDGDGAAALVLETNTGLVTSTAGSNTISIDLDNLGTVGLSASSNSITADAAVNKSSNTIAGDLPIGYTSATGGASDISNTTPLLDASGSLVASTVQLSLGEQADAIAAGNTIAIDLVSTGTQVLASAPALDDNTIAATISGNSSNSTIDIQSGAPSIFSGTAVVTNGQLNTADLSGTNSASNIFATIDSSAGTNTLSGSLSVEGNTISSSASGNEALGDGVAGNRILIADQVSVDGVSATGATANTVYSALTLTSAVDADLIVHNSQGNVGEGAGRVAVDASTTNATTGAAVEILTAGSISVSDNVTSASARGNIATGAFSTGANIASFAASVAVANQQTNTFADITANVSGTTSALVDPLTNVDTPTGGFVDVNKNIFSATAYGNQVSQSASLEAVSLGFPATSTVLSGGTGPDGHVNASGSAVVTNIQSQYSSSVSASDDSAVFLQLAFDNPDNGTTTGAALTVGENVQEAVAVGNNGSNALSLAANVFDGGDAMGAGAGIASVQIIADESWVSATSASNAYIDAREQLGSDVALTDNVQRAVAYGGLVSNSLAVSAQDATIDTDANGGVASAVNVRNGTSSGFVLDAAIAPTVTAAFAVLNDQSTSAVISATAGSDRSFSLSLGGETADLAQGSSLSNDGNTLAAAVYGNNASNGAELTVGNLDTGPDSYAAVLNLTNVQTVNKFSSMIARATGDQTVYTNVADKVSASSISTSDNTVQALAYGNFSNSDVVADATSIDTAATAGGGSTSVTSGPVNFSIATDGAFSLNSTQAQAGDMTATLLDAGRTSSASIYTEIQNLTEADNTGSSIVSNGNDLNASVTANRADNLMDLAGNALATSGALENFQMAAGDLSAEIGIKGADPQPAADEQVGGTTTDVGQGNGYVTYFGGTYSLTVANDPVLITFAGHTFTPAEVTYLQSLGYVTNIVVGTDSSFTIPIGTYTVYPDFNGISYGNGGPGLGDELIAFVGFTAPTVPAHGPLPGTPNVGGVSVAVGGNLIGDTVSVNNNIIAGAVTGNSAANAIAVSSTNDTGGSGHAVSNATVVGVTSAVGTSDYSLTNWQMVRAEEQTSTVYSALDINMEDAADITNSTLTIDGNSQSSRVVANNGANSIEISTTNLSAGSALLSHQSGRVALNSISDIDIFAPAAMSGSSVSMSNNSNTALAVMNNASNSSKFDVTNADPMGGASTDATIAQNTSAPAHDVSADHLLLNVHVAMTGGSVDATAATNIYNDDSLAGNTDSISGSSVTISGNVTSAEATANRAFNVMEFAAGSSLNASTAVDNGQQNLVAVNASATTSAGIALNGDFPALGTAAVLNSGITLGDNSTFALARGNSATNALNVSAGADYGVGTGSAASANIGSDPYLVSATLEARTALFNNQLNEGAVSATSTNASYVVALNDTTGNTLNNATIGVIGNSVAAGAYGNTAISSLSLTPLNTAMPTAAVGNRQYNTSAITAQVTTVGYGISSGVGAVSGSNLSVSANTISATAIGNNATNALLSN